MKGEGMDEWVGVREDVGGREIGGVKREKRGEGRRDGC